MSADDNPAVAELREFLEACIRHGIEQGIRLGYVEELMEGAGMRYRLTDKGSAVVHRIRRDRAAAQGIFH